MDETILKCGSHVSTRQGYLAAAKMTVRLGGGAFQYFPKNPRSLQLKAYDARDAAACKAWCETAGLVSVGHSAYAVNPAAEGEAAEAAARSVLNDLEIAEACGSIGTIVHFGASRSSDPLAGYRRVIAWLDRVLGAWTGRAKVLLENQAGDRGPFGTTPEELTQIRSLCAEPDKIGFCLDTCHLFASGEWKGAEDWEAFAERAGKLGYWASLAVVHLNDSVYPAGSWRDRHAAIGAGRIGEAGFRALLGSPEVRRAPLVLETPQPPGDGHREQLARVRAWASGER